MEWEQVCADQLRVDDGEHLHSDNSRNQFSSADTACSYIQLHMYMYLGYFISVIHCTVMVTVYASVS